MHHGSFDPALHDVDADADDFPAMFPCLATKIRCIGVARIVGTLRWAFLFKQERGK